MTSISDEILKAVSASEEHESKQQTNVQQHDTIVTQYKDIIREQVMHIHWSFYLISFVGLTMNDSS